MRCACLLLMAGNLTPLLQAEHTSAHELILVCPQRIATKAVRLKQLMPRTNVSALVSAWPDIVLHADLDKAETNLEQLRYLLQSQTSSSHHGRPCSGSETTQKPP